MDSTPTRPSAVTASQVCLSGPTGGCTGKSATSGCTSSDKAGKTWSVPNQGAVVRSDPDGSSFEVFSTGTRNLQEFAFDDRGNLISVDNDGDHSGEKERLVYLPYGSDSGWRSNWQYGKYTDTKNNRYNVWMGSVSISSRASPVNRGAHPCAHRDCTQGPVGHGLQPRYGAVGRVEELLLRLELPRCRAPTRGSTASHSRTMAPGFELEAEEKVLTGRARGGYEDRPRRRVVSHRLDHRWDSKNNGRLWKLDAPAAAGEPDSSRSPGAARARTFAGVPSTEVAALLRHQDMRVRQKAQFDLVRRGDSGPWLGRRAMHPAIVPARVHASGALPSSLARKHGAKNSALLTPFLSDDDGEIRAQAAR